MSLQLLRRKQAEGEDVPVVCGRQDKQIVVAPAHVSHEAVVVVVHIQGPVGLHGREVRVIGLQGVDPDGAGVHPTEEQLPVGAEE